MLKLNFRKVLYTLLIGFLFITNVNAQEAFVIDSFNIDVKVNENYSLDVTEEINVNFSEYRHGIYRDIPTSGTLVRQDGTSSNFRARVKNVEVNEEFESSSEGNGIRIKIGDPDRTITGQKTYRISYTYYMGKDQLDNFDEFYYNLIGEGWDTTISNIKFSIVMPKEFDSSKLGFSKGAYGTADANGINFSVDGTTILGTVDKLNNHEALTVRCELDDGYFTLETNSFLDFLYFLPLGVLAFAYMLWKKYGVDDVVVESVEFYPPEGMNSLDVAFNYNGRVISNDVISLLIYLANKGYLSIKESTTGKVFKKEGFTLTKLKDYDGTNEDERTFFNEIFISKNSVTDEDLKYKFYETMNKILTRKNTKQNKDVIFESKASKSEKTVGLLLIISVVVICLKPFINNFYVGAGSVFIAAVVSFLVCLLVPYGIIKNSRKKMFFKIVIVCIFAVLFLFLAYTFVYNEGLLSSSLSLIGFIVSTVALAGVTFFLGIMPKRTPYGVEILGKIGGFKSFLETSEKEKLEMLVEQDPSYFYNILPYTYVLGVSNKWIKKFEDIKMEPPEWYDSPAYNYYTFTHFMNDTMSNANSAMSTPEPSSSGGGGFTGGGFSGGGFGGGGGGSW